MRQRILRWSAPCALALGLVSFGGYRALAVAQPIILSKSVSLSVVDNTYGANVSEGWTRGHTFGNFTGSDRAQFRLKNGVGVVVMDFSMDHVSASSAYPSGYGSLGVTGGDGDIGTRRRRSLSRGARRP